MVHYLMFQVNSYLYLKDMPSIKYVVIKELLSMSWHFMAYVVHSLLVLLA